MDDYSPSTNGNDAFNLLQQRLELLINYEINILQTYDKSIRKIFPAILENKQKLKILTSRISDMDHDIAILKDGLVTESTSSAPGHVE